MDRSSLYRRVHHEHAASGEAGMESVLMGHPEREMPFCVKRYRIRDCEGNVLFESGENHQTRNTIRLSPPAVTRGLSIDVLETHGAPAALFGVRCYE
jgi:hypothetical protein